MTRPQPAPLVFRSTRTRSSTPDYSTDFVERARQGIVQHIAPFIWGNNASMTVPRPTTDDLGKAAITYRTAAGDVRQVDGPAVQAALRQTFNNDGVQVTQDGNSMLFVVPRPRRLAGCKGKAQTPAPPPVVIREQSIPPRQLRNSPVPVPVRAPTPAPSHLHSLSTSRQHDALMVALCVLFVVMCAMLIL